MSSINTNIQAISAARNLDRSQEMLGRSLNRLSSGSKIVDPSDDPAGLAVSERLDAQSLRAQAASTNIQNAVSYLQTADGFMDGMGKTLSRMGELNVLASDPTKGPSDIALYQQEFTALQDQLRTTIGGTTAEIGGTSSITSPLGSFNDIPLFGPNPAGTTVSIGSAVGENMTIQDSNFRTGPMLSLINQDPAGAYGLKATDPTTSDTITQALQQVATQRATLGASQSRLELAGTSLTIESQNLSSTLSRIRDVDVAQESTQMAKYNILVQSGTAMLAQANQTPQSVLKLLQS